MANDKNFVVKNGLDVGKDISANNITANTVTADIAGNANTASSLETARTIALSGAVTGSTSFDGSGNVTIATTATADPTLTLTGDVTGSATFTNLGNATLTATVADDSHNHVISNIDGLQTALDGKLSTTGKAADSNLLDGIDSSAFLRSNTNDTFTNLTGTSLTIGAGVTLAESTDRADLLQITSNTSTWGGLQIRNSSNEGRWSFMTNGGTAGIYDDENNDWAIQMLENSEVRLYFNGGEKLNTTSTGVTVAGNITATRLIGSADTLTTARNIALTGAVTGNANFDGSGNISIATTATSDPTLTINGDASGSATFTNLGNATLTLTVADDSHNHTIANVDGLQTALDGKLSTSGKAADSELLDGINSSQFLRSDANDTLTSVMKVASSGNLIYEKDTSQGFIPLLAQAKGGGSTTGAIKVAFPVHGTADMIMGFVDIFDYASNESVTLFVAGYLYQTTGNNEWVNETVSIVTGSTSKDYTVRFGADGSSNCFWIGETTSTWGYPQVTLRDWSVGYTADVDAYATGTTISFVTSFDTVDATVSGNLPVASDSNLLDGINSSQFLRSDTNDTMSGRLEMGNVLDLNNNDIYGVDQIFHQGDTDTYIQFHAADQFRVVTGGAERLEVNNSETKVTSGNFNAAAGDVRSRGAGFRNATGNYGTIRVDDDRGVTWAGFAIRDDWVFMSNGAEDAGIYNDTDNEWMTRWHRNAQTEIHHNGSVKLATTSGGVAVTGAITATGDITAFFSDERLKDFKGKIKNPLEKIKALNGYYYTANELAQSLGYTDEMRVGVSAQQVQTVLPEVVARAPISDTNGVDEDYLTVKYEKMIPLLIEAIKDQQDLINEMRTEINMLKDKVSE